jgi:type VI secretion system protein ImpL
MKMKFGQLYLYYLVWRSDTGEINKEIKILQAWLNDLLSTKRTNLRWLVLWVNRQGTIPYITLRDFWGGSLSLSNEKSVAPSFTKKGKEAIDSFTKEIETALPNPLILAHQKVDFEKWFPTVCFDAWQNFAAFFPRGAERLKGIKEWQPVASKMATEQGPYFACINRIATDRSLEKKVCPLGSHRFITSGSSKPSAGLRRKVESWIKPLMRQGN